MATLLAEYPPFLTDRDIAAALQIHEKTVPRLVKQNQLPQPIKISGGIRRWKREVVEQFLDAK
jgi:predicted DNA-binding transcriptional regulator AlpA